MEGKVTRLYSVFSLGDAYVSGDDSNLNNPSGAYDQDDNFKPVNDDAEYASLRVGSNVWDNDTQSVGSGRTWYGSAGSSNYGTVKIVIGGGVNWGAFAPSSYNGIQRIKFAKSANNDEGGGYIDFYYHYQAWYNAFYDNSSDIVFAIDGSVYKGSISYDNLVITGDGIIGPAGGASNSIFISQNKFDSISPEIISISKHGEHIIL